MASVESHSHEDAACKCKDAGITSPFTDQKFKTRPKVYAGFIADLWARGLIRFDAEAETTVGVFHVPKKGGRQRLAVDTRVANCHFIEPHHFALPTAAAMSNLECDIGDDLWAAQIDVDSAFYRFAMPEGMEHCFVLPPVRVRQLVEAGVEVPAELAALTAVSPLMMVLPMGFN